MKTRSRRRTGTSTAVTLTAAIAVALGAAVALPGGATAAPTYPAPEGDSFYAAPADIGVRSSGDVLKTRTISSAVFPGTTATQLEYRSTNSAGAPIAAVTTV